MPDPIDLDLAGAHGPREETQGPWFNSGKPEPTNIDPNATGVVRWQQCYRALRQLKFWFEEQHNR